MAHTHDFEEWPVKRILTELCTPERRREIAATFWKAGDDQSRRLAMMQLAKTLHFREETLKKAPAEKKADYLLTRLGAHEFENAFEIALMLFHTGKQKAMLAAFLDHWKIPHDDGAIESDDYKVPETPQVLEAVEALKDRFPIEDIRLYLASVGLLMGDEWAHSTWPALDALA